MLYFNFDQGAGTILEDKNGPSDIELVSVAEGFQYISSGAAVGDVSLANYITPQSLVFVHPDGDSLLAERTSGSSTGIHIYRTDFMPPVPSNTDNALIESMDSSRYWGIFAVHSYNTNCQYRVANYYSHNTQVNMANEDELRLLSRFDNASIPWLSNITELPNLSNHSITLFNQIRGEYVLGGTTEQTFNEYLAPDQPIFLPDSNNTNPDTVCGNSTGLLFALQPDPYAESYRWTIPEGLDGFSTGDTIILNASYTGSDTITVHLSVVAINAYGESNSTSYAVFMLPAPNLADAGPDQVLIPPLTSTSLEGNLPSALEIGLWDLNYGTATILQPDNPTSAVSGIGLGQNSLSWSISTRYAHHRQTACLFFLVRLRPILFCRMETPCHVFFAKA